MIGGSVMSLLSTSETKQKIAEEVQNTEDNLQIISAFCKTPAIEFVDQNIKRNITTKKLLVRFLLSDIINDATDFQSSWDMTCFYLCDVYHTLTFPLCRFLELCCA